MFLFLLLFIRNLFVAIILFLTAVLTFFWVLGKYKSLQSDEGEPSQTPSQPELQNGPNLHGRLSSASRPYPLRPSEIRADFPINAPYGARFTATPVVAPRRLSFSSMLTPSIMSGQRHSLWRGTTADRRVTFSLNREQQHQWTAIINYFDGSFEYIWRNMTLQRSYAAASFRYRVQYKPSKNSRLCIVVCTSELHPHRIPLAPYISALTFEDWWKDICHTTTPFFCQARNGQEVHKLHFTHRYTCSNTFVLKCCFKRCFESKCR